MDFVRVREADSPEPYRDYADIEAGKEYEVYIYYHNNFDEKTAERQAKRKKLMADGKEAAQKTLEDQMAKAIEWIKKPENQKKLIEAGAFVFQLVVTKKMPKINPLRN